MKTIGLIGGMSWESTVPYYSTINEVVKQRLGGLHSARLILLSVDFAAAPHGDGTAQDIVRRLRAADAMTVSLVAELDGLVRGHVAASPVTVGGRVVGWHGLGPVGVEPTVQGLEWGSGLVRECLSVLQASGSRGCVVLGDPDFDGRFGLGRQHRRTYAAAPAEYLRAMAFSGEAPEGPVAYHPAFGGA